MDDILAKHLTSTLLLLKNEEKPLISDTDTIIPFYSYKIIDKNYLIKTNEDTIMSENVGYWKDKPIILYKDKKYVLLESSSNIVRIDNLGIDEESITDYVTNTKNIEEQISNNLLKSIKSIITTNKPVDPEEQISNNLLKSIKNIITTSKPVVKQKEKPVIRKPKIVKKVVVPVKPEIKDTLNASPLADLTAIKNVIEPLDTVSTQEFDKQIKPEIPSPEEIVKNVNEITPKKTDDKHSVISHYVNTLKKADQQPKEEVKPEVDTINYLSKDKPKSIEEELFALLDSKKDDPRFKRFFSHYTEQTKKEVHEINEKYAKQYLAKLLENGGGGGTSNSAVDYSKGGTIDGDLTITSNLSVIGTVYGNIDNKRVFYIGNPTDTDYVLDHNFNTKDLIVSIYDQNDEMVLTSVKNINNNQSLISFNSPIENIKVVIMR
jgi:hypothetical protein